VSVSDVEATVAGAELQDEWALVRAIEQGDTATALRELGLKLDASPASPKELSAMILGQLRWMVSAPRPKRRFPEERIRPAVEALFRTDLALKTSAGDPRVLLERLVVELCEKGGAATGRAATWASARRTPRPGA
jgi:DNA polymerase III delta subunit